MITTLNPKQEFQIQHKDCAAELASNRESRWLKVSLSYAIAQAAVFGLPAQALHQFSEILLNLAEKETLTEPLPQQRLETYDNEAKSESPETPNEQK